MSDRVHRKQRPLLPEGYQYGDAGLVGWAAFWAGVELRRHQIAKGPLRIALPARWRAPHENAAAQLMRQQEEGVAAAAKHFGDDANARMFRLGVDTCPTCGTTGKYDCADCGIPYYAKLHQQRTGDETL